MPRPRLRLLIDENLSPRIARALAQLGFDVEAVQDCEALGKSASDVDVLAYAAQHRRVIVTINFDMVLICAEARQRVIWIDPKRKRSLTYEEMVVRLFQGVSVWEPLLEDPVIIHARKTMDQVLTFEEAGRAAHRRMERQRVAQRRRARRANPDQGQL